MATTFTICSNCLAINKLDSERQGEPKCGRCKQSLGAIKTVADVTARELNALIASSPLPVVVDFWAPWCGPCRSFAPTFATVAQSHLGKSVFVKVNTEAERQVSPSYGIRGIPTLMVFINGGEVARISGALDQTSLERWLAEHKA